MAKPKLDEIKFSLNTLASALRDSVTLVYRYGSPAYAEMTDLVAILNQIYDGQLSDDLDFWALSENQGPVGHRYELKGSKRWSTNQQSSATFLLESKDAAIKVTGGPTTPAFSLVENPGNLFSITDHANGTATLSWASGKAPSMTTNAPFHGDLYEPVIKMQAGGFSSLVPLKVRVKNRTDPVVNAQVVSQVPGRISLRGRTHTIVQTPITPQVIVQEPDSLTLRGVLHNISRGSPITTSPSTLSLGTARAVRITVQATEPDDIYARWGSLAPISGKRFRIPNNGTAYTLNAPPGETNITLEARSGSIDISIEYLQTPPTDPTYYHDIDSAIEGTVQYNTETVLALGSHDRKFLMSSFDGPTDVDFQDTGSLLTEENAVGETPVTHTTASTANEVGITGV